MYPAKLIKKNDGHYLWWDDDEGSISKLLSNGRVYSRHCAKSKPHYCQNCNPHVSFTQLKKPYADQMKNLVGFNSTMR